MALLNANFLGLYAFANSGQTTAYTVAQGSTAQNAETVFEASTGSGAYGILVSDTTDDVYEKSNKPAIVKNNGGSSAVDATGDLKLLAAATSTTLDLSNAIDEVVARGVQCESQTFIISGAQSWNLTADGLVQSAVDGAESGATRLMDIARAGEFVLVRFVLNVNKKDTDGDDEEQINYIGQALVENVSISGGFDDTATYSVSLRGYGKLYRYQHT